MNWICRMSIILFLFLLFMACHLYSLLMTWHLYRVSLSVYSRIRLIDTNTFKTPCLFVCESGIILHLWIIICGYSSYLFGYFLHLKSGDKWILRCFYKICKTVENLKKSPLLFLFYTAQNDAILRLLKTWRNTHFHFLLYYLTIQNDATATITC